MFVFAQHLRYILRQLRQAPGFALTAILTLALGIGATTAIFSLVYAVLLRSLPVASPGELWRVGSHNECCYEGGYKQEDEQKKPDFSVFSYPFYEYLRDHVHGFSSLAAFQAGQETLVVRRQGGAESPASVPGAFVSGNAFSTLGVPAYAGRQLSPSDDRQGVALVAMISYRAWQQSYGGDPSITGSTFLINGNAVSIVGITPPGFYGDKLDDVPPEFYLPVASEPQIKPEGTVLKQPVPHWLHLIGRIPHGTDVHAVEAETNVALQQWLRSHVSDMHEDELKHLAEQRTRLTPGGAGVTPMQETYSSGLHILLAASLFVLLIACANIANLMLARGTARRQQTSIRMAIGASRGRLIAQALEESVVLSLLGGVAGVLVAYGGTRLIIHYAFAQAKGLPISATPSIAVLLFAFAASLLTGVLFGIAPAMVTSHSNPVDALRGANRSVQSGASVPQKALVVLQAAVSLVLLCAAALFTGSLRQLEKAHYGFQPQGRVVMQVDADHGMKDPAQFASFYRELLRRLNGIPGVGGATYALYSPMEGDNWSDATYVEGQAPRPRPEENMSSFNRVGPGYFDVTGIRILRGRAMTDQEVAEGRPVALIDETFARKFFGANDPIGHHIGLEEIDHAGEFEVIGVTEDTRYSTWDLHDPVRPMWYAPLSHWSVYSKPEEQTLENRSHFASAIVVRTSNPPSAIEPQARAILASIDPNIAIDSIRTMQEEVSNQFSQESLIARLASLFGILALVLASVGLYGVTAYAVERRTAEIGIRMALGADRQSVLRMVLRGAFAQVLVGVCIGIPAALLAGRLIASQLYGVSPYNLSVLVTTALLLAIAALIASLVPAGRASRIDPMVALRSE